MIVGDKNVFAIETYISKAYNRSSFLALGYFVVYILGARYGVYKSDATMLGCSFDEVEQRVKARGAHVAKFTEHLSAGIIADGFRIAIYCSEPHEVDQTTLDVIELFKKDNRFVWAPDGDAAFDDGSYILHFDCGDQVRLIAFRCNSNGLHDPATMMQLWIPEDKFYSVLETWLCDFHAQWVGLEKEKS